MMWPRAAGLKPGLRNVAGDGVPPGGAARAGCRIRTLDGLARAWRDESRPTRPEYEHREQVA